MFYLHVLSKHRYTVDAGSLMGWCCPGVFLGCIYSKSLSPLSSMGKTWRNCLASDVKCIFGSCFVVGIWWFLNNFQVWEGCSLQPRHPQVFLAAVVYYWYHYFAPRLWPQTDERQDGPMPVTAGTATPTPTAVPVLPFKALSQWIGLRMFKGESTGNGCYPETLWDWELRAELRAGCSCGAVQNSTVVRNLKSGRLLCRPKKLLVCKRSLDLTEIRLFAVTFHDFPVKCICDLEEHALFISHFGADDLLRRPASC